MSRLPKSFPFPECLDCKNRIYDPFQCESCKRGSNYEPEDTEEDIEYEDFLEMFRGR